MMPMRSPCLPSGTNFKALDFEKVHASMHRPSFLFDGRNLLDQAAMDAIGFEMHSIWKIIQSQEPTKLVPRPGRASTTLIPPATR